MRTPAAILGLRSTSIALALTFTLSGCAGTRADEPVIGGPCEGCRLVFEGMPEAPGRPRGSRRRTSRASR